MVVVVVGEGGAPGATPGYSTLSNNPVPIATVLLILSNN